MQVVDVIVPTVLCEESIVLIANDQCKAAVPKLMANGTDNCDSNVSLSQNYNENSLITIGNTNVNVTATDASGNKVNNAIVKLTSEEPLCYHITST